MFSIIAREPVRVAALGLVTAVLALAVAFGAHISEGQVAAIVAFVAAVFGVAEAVRSQYTPVANREDETG